MSVVRTHFCTLTARSHFGVSWPRKYGLNGTMPAATNSRVGSSRISEALGTTVWSRPSKWARNLLRISAVSIGDALSCAGRCCAGERGGAGGLEPVCAWAGDCGRLRRRKHAVCRGAGPQLAHELGLALAGRDADLGGEEPGQALFGDRPPAP